MTADPSDHHPSDHAPPDRHPYRWGDPARPATLPAAVTEALGHLGVREPASGPVDAADVRLPDPVLPEEVRDELAALVGAEHVRSDHAARVAHTRGWSTPDLLRLRAGDGRGAPDAVAYPASHDDVLRVLALCSRERVA
ncbi:MAG: hypothetical protein ACRDO8_13475, partial [Nocardioidaceae bacterium]